MKIEKALVIRKKSLYQVYVEEHKEPSFLEALKKNDRNSNTILETHSAQIFSEQWVRRYCEHFNVEVDIKNRGDISSAEGYDLVVSVGGDGTALSASHIISDGTPLLGINSCPKTSVGHLCAGNSDDFFYILRNLMEDKGDIISVNRLRVQVDGEDISPLPLNDLLYAHSCPAGTTRFKMKVGIREESDDIKSSGIWVSTAVGSTGAIRSSGGMGIPVESGCLQYLVREPFVRPQEDKKIMSEMVEEGQSIVIVSRMRDSAIWIDGSHHVVPIKYGQEIVLTSSESKLNLVK